MTCQSDQLLVGFIEDVQASGGIIGFSDGLHAPVADLTWTDLGKRIVDIQRYLQDKGMKPYLEQQNVLFSSSEASQYV
jgi:hypothetical protein